MVVRLAQNEDSASHKQYTLKLFWKVNYKLERQLNYLCSYTEYSQKKGLLFKTASDKKVKKWPS